jgi:hypothetical protein
MHDRSGAVLGAAITPALARQGSIGAHFPQNLCCDGKAESVFLNTRNKPENLSFVINRTLAVGYDTHKTPRSFHLSDALSRMAVPLEQWPLILSAGLLGQLEQTKV